MNIPQNQPANDQKYNLVDTDLEPGAPGQVIRSGITLSPSEADQLNYAMALNGAGRKFVRVICAEGHGNSSGNLLLG